MLNKNIVVNFNTLKDLRTITKLEELEPDFRDMLDDMREEQREQERKDYFDNHPEEHESFCNCSQC